MNKEIEAFFNERKAAWLKKNTKASMSESELNALTQECEQVFSLENWLPSAAKRAKSRSFSTHPSKFSHPSTGVGDKNKKNTTYVSPVICEAEFKCDGFLRTGNLFTGNDSLGNAAELDVEEFLTLIMPDGKTLLSHIVEETELAVSLLNIKETSYEVLRKGFLAVVETNGDIETSSKVKQVFFPTTGAGQKFVGEEVEYHLLSIVTASPLVFELKKRISKIRSYNETQVARENEKANLPDAQGYKRLYNLTTIGYGGTKPQNISVLNNQNGGKAHLLMSSPPVLKKRDIHFPTDNFFAQTYRYYKCEDIFKALHGLYKKENKSRDERDDLYLTIIERIGEQAWLLRAASQEQYFEQTSTLSSAQKIWLCHDREEARNQEEDWLDEIVTNVTDYIFFGYEKLIGKHAFKFGDGEYKHIKKLVSENKEILR